MSKISVIIPNYNYGRYLRQAVQSALDQTLRPHEIIVVDDGSTDESKEILRGFGDSIKIIEQSNKGVAAARNNGAEIADGEFLAFLDADDYWHNEKLEKQMEKFDSDAEIGFVHCGHSNVDENGVHLDDYISGQEGWVASELLRFQEVVIANTIIVRREVFKKVGGYDTNRELHPSEDWDLCYRLARVCKLGFVRESLLYYRQHGQGGHTNIGRMERAMLTAFEKAFLDPAKDIQQLRSEAYGNLYLVLAGSYYHSGQAGKAVISALKGVIRYPPIAARLFEFPVRLIKRQI
ncbi:MAG: glycosyltransferase family 2 protein [Pyrinomonadaceae bacterium]